MDESREFMSAVVWVSDYERLAEFPRLFHLNMAEAQVCVEVLQDYNGRIPFDRRDRSDMPVRADTQAAKRVDLFHGNCGRVIGDNTVNAQVFDLCAYRKGHAKAVPFFLMRIAFRCLQLGSFCMFVSG